MKTAVEGFCSSNSVVLPMMCTSANAEVDRVRWNRSEADVISFGEDVRHDFLPDEGEQDARLAAANVLERMTNLERQMMAQYSALATYATIAQRSTDMAKAEHRSDLDRSQSTVIGLVERVRRECADSIEGVGRRLDGGTNSDAARLHALEQRFATLTAALERSLDAQRSLVEHVTMLLGDKMQRDGWLVSHGTAAELSLR